MTFSRPRHAGRIQKFTYHLLPSQGTFVSRHFDPNTLEIKFVGDVFSLGPIAEEALLLSERVNAALVRMNS